tara:strand:+ start:1463 stop:1672 length:210 start_codon:yes stop_codon:yes gene_type:complete
MKKFKVGDLVRNTHEGRARILPGEGLGIVLQIDQHRVGDEGKYQQIKVATAQGITYWWPAVTEVVDESR